MSDSPTSKDLAITKEERDAQEKVLTSEEILNDSDIDIDEINSLFGITEIVITKDVKKIAVIADIHSNMVAFEEVLKDMKNREYDLVINLGDLVGYYTEPEEAVTESRKISDVTILGNHDFALIEDEKLLYTTMQEASQLAIDHNKKLVSKDNKKYIRALPMKIKLITKLATILLVHGDPITIYGYVYGPTPELFEKSIKSALEAVDTDYLLVGHSHIQGEYFDFHTGKIFVNPGAIGQPRDGDARAAYCIIDLEKRTNEMIRVPYDISKVKAQLAQESLPIVLGDRLEFGK